MADSGLRVKSGPLPSSMREAAVEYSAVNPEPVAFMGPVRPILP